MLPALEGVAVQPVPSVVPTVGGVLVGNAPTVNINLPPPVWAAPEVVNVVVDNADALSDDPAPRSMVPLPVLSVSRVKSPLVTLKDAAGATETFPVLATKEPLPLVTLTPARLKLPEATVTLAPVEAVTETLDTALVLGSVKETPLTVNEPLPTLKLTVGLAMIAPL